MNSVKSLPTVWQHYADLLEKAVGSLGTYPGGYSGTGIVIGGGGGTYFACALVCYQMLRHLGCRLPVQLWHLGAGEIDPLMGKVASQAGLEVVDALRVVKELSGSGREIPRRLNGWELKSFAIEHCSYREVLYLDADNVPVKDPTFLFEDSGYRELGAIFWPDLPPPRGGEWIPRDVKRLVGLEGVNSDREGDNPALESGQLLVNKERCWRELQVVRHLSDYSDFWYQRVYGDKDTFWLAWHKLNTDYVKPGKCNWNRPSIQQYAPATSGGGLIFQHACQGKLELARAQRIPSLLYHDEVRDVGIALRRRWHGQIWDCRDETPQERAIANYLLGKYHYRRQGHRGEQRLELLSGGRIGEGMADNERRWTLRLLPPDLSLYPYDSPNLPTRDNASITGNEDSNHTPTRTPLFPSSQERGTGTAPTLVVVGGGSKRNEIGMMFLRQLEGREGTWTGHWQAHDRGRVVLERMG